MTDRPGDVEALHGRENWRRQVVREAGRPPVPCQPARPFRGRVQGTWVKGRDWFRLHPPWPIGSLLVPSSHFERERDVCFKLEWMDAYSLTLTCVLFCLLELLEMILFCSNPQIHIVYPPYPLYHSQTHCTVNPLLLQYVCRMHFLCIL